MWACICMCVVYVCMRLGACTQMSAGVSGACVGGCPALSLSTLFPWDTVTKSGARLTASKPHHSVFSPAPTKYWGHRHRLMRPHIAFYMSAVDLISCLCSKLSYSLRHFTSPCFSGFCYSLNKGQDANDTKCKLVFCSFLVFLVLFFCRVFLKKTPVYTLCCLEMGHWGLNTFKFCFLMRMPWVLLKIHGFSYECFSLFQLLLILEHTTPFHIWAQKIPLSWSLNSSHPHIIYQVFNSFPCFLKQSFEFMNFKVL